MHTYKQQILNKHKNKNIEPKKFSTKTKFFNKKKINKKIHKKNFTKNIFNKKKKNYDITTTINLQLNNSKQ